MSLPKHMTVAELVAILQAMPQDAVVMASDSEFADDLMNEADIRLVDRTWYEPRRLTDPRSAGISVPYRDPEEWRAIPFKAVVL